MVRICLWRCRCWHLWLYVMEESREQRDHNPAWMTTTLLHFETGNRITAHDSYQHICFHWISWGALTGASPKISALSGYLAILSYAAIFIGEENSSNTSLTSGIKKNLKIYKQACHKILRIFQFAWWADTKDLWLSECWWFTRCDRSL